MLPGGSLTIRIKICVLLKVTSISNNMTDENAVNFGNHCDLLTDLKAATSTMQHCDVQLCCDGRAFSCHKFILGARSSVFRAMFALSMRESQENHVDISDVSPKALDQFVKFIYTDNIDDTSFTVVKQLLFLAEKYDVQKLKACCMQLLYPDVTVENVCEILKMGNLHNDTVLKNRAMEYILQAADQVIKTEGWKSMQREAPELCSEILSYFSQYMYKFSSCTQ